MTKNLEPTPFMRCLQCCWFGTAFDPDRCDQRPSKEAPRHKPMWATLYGRKLTNNALGTLKRQARPEPKTNVQVIMKARPGQPL